jgi:hypothetical protein
MNSSVEKASEIVKGAHRSLIAAVRCYLSVWRGLLAQRALIAVVRRAYPVDAKVFVKQGHCEKWVKVTGHHDKTGEGAGLIYGVIMDTGEKCRFRDVNVIEWTPIG